MNPVLTISVMLLMSSFAPQEVLPAFRDSILAGNPGACTAMVSSRAMEDIDSVMVNHPYQVETMLAYFGLQADVPDLEGMEAAELLETLLAGEGAKAYILMFGVTPGEPITHQGETFVPVTWGLFGNIDTVYVQLTEEDGDWKIRDFFHELPAPSAAVRTGRGN
jgi:hypothetical protein